MRITRTRSILVTLVLGLCAGAGLNPPERAAGTAARAPLRLVLNLSARRLHVYENGERTRSYTVAVGMPGHRTPVGNYRISRVVWNPWWRPPAREWTRGKKDMRPGPNNPMGRVKMYFRELYYIHGTPETGTLGQAVSHGCVRMSNGNAIALARLVHSYGSPNVSEAELDGLVANTGRTRTIWLKRPVPLEVVSSSSEVRDGRLEFYAGGGAVSGDRVGEDASAALASAGLDLPWPDRARRAGLSALARRAPVSVPPEAPTTAAGPVRSS